MDHLSETIDQIRKVLGNRVSTDQSDLQNHSNDLSRHHKRSPDAVCFPRSETEVAEIVKICNRFRTPIIPFGAGTSLEGHVIPCLGGISVDLSGMDKIIQIHEDDLDCVVEPGVKKLQLNNVLESKGLFFAAGPAIDATIGGMLATGASGANAYKYGTVRENIRSLKMVTPTGALIKTGNRARKSSAGYDLTHLVIGSEGTLGIITEATVRLHRLPGFAAVSVASFDSIKQAIEATVMMIRKEIPLAMLELLDENAMSAVNRYSGTSHPETPTLFLEIHSAGKDADIYKFLIENIIHQEGGYPLDWATDPELRSKLWKIRYDMAYANRAMRPEGSAWSTDVCVPITNLARCILETKKDLEDAPFPVTVFGHIGDGNFHVSMIYNPDDPAEVEYAKNINHKLVLRAIQMEGTCSGEHGIGLGKKSYLTRDVGEGAVEYMKSIKKALDPNNIMNPGKIF